MNVAGEQTGRHGDATGQSGPHGEREAPLRGGRSEQGEQRAQRDERLAPQGGDA
ncbi:hypothetical protein QZM19_01700 [Burkholderia multivorans]|uniref:hypothetical protein n=1 Tax=Burkholderia multivorans TaxID=87883 RepID=UPI0015E3E410|nr:hypothetical protein [Burkholderia multivorans]MCA8318430.1 hypothetical protein [Burkholderia multivorans]MDN7479083.1 hypothetical protein [Burkholderia multivorans]MDN7862095.1 hypothetical protein [Burkholderia multivorans]